MSEEFTLGDSKPYVVNLVIGTPPATFEIDPLVSTVKAMIISKDRKTSYTAEAITLDSEYPGADWETSKLIVKFPKSSTSSVTYQGPALLEIQIETENVDPELDPDNLTCYIPITLVKGRIA